MRIVEDFDDPLINRERWDGLLSSGPTDVIFLTLDWQREWWRAYGSGRLMLVVAEEDGEPQAIAPLYTDDDMLMLVGSGESDYLDFIGDVDEPILAAMLAAARQQVPDFAGIALHNVPAGSRTTALLPSVAIRLGLDIYNEGEIEAPYLDLTDRQRVAQVVDRPKLRKEQSRMRREGPLQFRDATEHELDDWLDHFFAQHTLRWTGKGDAQFRDERHRSFCRRIVHVGHRAGWLRFTSLEWNGTPAAFSISLLYKGRWVWLLASRDASITRYSPGKHLEAHLIRAALSSGMQRYDFGLGDDDFKLRHATAAPQVASWALWA